MKKKDIVVFILFFLPTLFLGIVVCMLSLTVKGRLLVLDVEHYKKRKGLNAHFYVAFVVLFVRFPEFRSIVYWRLGKYLYFLCPLKGRQNLFIYTKCLDVKGGLYIGHGWSTVINAGKIGRNCVVGQNVTIGSNKLLTPIIGDNVSIWAHSVVLGGIEIGNNTQIGAGSVVVKSVGPNSVVVPCRSRIIKQNDCRVDIPL